MNKREVNDALRAAKTFVSKVEEIMAHESYKTMLTLAWAHGVVYDGPTFGEELAALKQAIQDFEEGV